MWFVSYICQLFMNFQPIKKMNSQSWLESWLIIHIQRVTQGYQCSVQIFLKSFSPWLPHHTSWSPYLCFWSGLCPISHHSQMCISIERSQWAPGNGNLLMLLPLPKIQWFLFLSPRSNLIFSIQAEKEMATHSSMLAWRIPWTEESDVLWSMGLQRVRHGWSNLEHTSHVGLIYLVQKYLLKAFCMWDTAWQTGVPW